LPRGNHSAPGHPLSLDPKVVRVAGPFTVESLSPHRVVAGGPEDLIDPPAPIEDSGRFVETILDNLRSSGVDNRVKGERLRFETLDPFPWRFLQATGTFCEGDATRKVAVAIGPQYGTVGPDLVREAALEAGGYFDVLVVCGFAFDARADEETGKAMRFGKLTVLTARMNPDLAMADELLKKTRSGNLFTVFGQPDIDIRPSADADGQLQVEIHGLDVYDPTTGVVRSDSAPTTHTTSSSAPSAPTSTRPPGPRSTRPSRAPSRARQAAGSPSR
jgi:adenine-specific DNA-methyltransferase